MGIEQAFAIMKERIKPAVLVSEGKAGRANGITMQDWCAQNGINVMTASDEDAADALYRAVTAKAESLHWLVKPAKVQKLYENEKVRNQATARQDQNEFAEKAKKAEAAKEYQKQQDAALRQINDLIGNFMLTDGASGRIAHGKTDAVKQTLRNHVEKAVKNKRDLTVVAKEVQKYMNEQYEKAEKALELV